MRSYKIILAIIVIGVIQSSCSEPSLEQPTQTFESDFERLQGNMRPADRFDTAYVGCLRTWENRYNNCCYSKDVQTYISHDHLIVRSVADGIVIKTIMTTANKGVVIIKHGTYVSVYRNLEGTTAKVLNTKKDIIKKGHEHNTPEID